MFTYKIRQLFLLFLIPALLTSCVSKKNFYYFQDQISTSGSNDSTSTVFNHEHKIKPDDILSIYVTSLSPDASSYFNTPVSRDGAFNRADLPLITGYTVDLNGYIELPLVGSLYVHGLTLIQVKDTIKSKLENYLINPAVRVNIENFRLTVLGEVLNPGSYTTSKEKMNVAEVLAMAGDLTTYAVRTNILVVRENGNGVKEYGYLDITSREVFKSKYYYLQPNDILYVSARKTKIISGDFLYRIAPFAMSLITFLSVFYTRYGE